MDYGIEDFLEYKKYLNTISEVLKRYFDDQKEYICCKDGCSHCCEYGAYPYSDLEFKYLLLGFCRLDMNEQRKIITRIQALKEEYKNCGNKGNFYHRCPFLNDNKSCSVYEYRGLICRTFGLITQLKNGKYTLPFCCDLGLNYSKVYDSKSKKIDYDMVKKYGYKVLPNAYKTSLANLMSDEIFEGEPLNFGEIKSLIEWL